MRLFLSLSVIKFRNQKDDFKIRRFRIDYNEKYENDNFDYHRANQNIS